MENRRRQKWDNQRKSQNRKPPRGTSGSWQPTVPSWEKEFCRLIGSLEWERLLQMKKFTHLYDNVIKWDDSAGEEAFSNAKKRFWAEKNGLPCETLLPDPDLYIDKIVWDSDTGSQLLPDFELEHVEPTVDADHDPVVIFGDSLLPNGAYSTTGWGDEDENFKAPANTSSANLGSPWVQNWGNTFDNGATFGWPDYSSNTWNIGDGNGAGGYRTWGDGWNNEWGWDYNNNVMYGVQPHSEHKVCNDGEWGQWNDSNISMSNNLGDASTDQRFRAQGNEHHRNHTTYWGQQSTVDNRSNAREWDSFNSYGPSNHHSAITVGQTWNQ